LNSIGRREGYEMKKNRSNFAPCILSLLLSMDFIFIVGGVITTVGFF
jgi:hypothetical protein